MIADKKTDELEQQKEEKQEETMKRPGLKFWRTWDDGQKARATKTLGVFLALFTVFTLISTLSYIFTWKHDMGREFFRSFVPLKYANI